MTNTLNRAVVLSFAAVLWLLAERLPTMQAKPNPPTSGAGPVAEDADNLKVAVQQYEDAFNYYEAVGKFNEARKIYQRILNKFPNYLQARYRLGWCFLAAGDNERAIREWRLVLEGKNNTESFIQELCEHIQKASCPKLDRRGKETLDRAVSHLDAARALQSRVFQIAEIRGLSRQEDPSLREADLWRRSRAVLNRIAMHAREAAEAQSVADKGYAPAYLVCGEGWQIMVEMHQDGLSIESFRVEATTAYKKYLHWYDKLNVPDTPKVKDIRARVRLMESEWNLP